MKPIIILIICKVGGTVCYINASMITFRMVYDYIRADVGPIIFEFADNAPMAKEQPITPVNPPIKPYVQKRGLRLSSCLTTWSISKIVKPSPSTNQYAKVKSKGSIFSD